MVKRRNKSINSKQILNDMQLVWYRSCSIIGHSERLNVLKSLWSFKANKNFYILFPELVTYILGIFANSHSRFRESLNEKENIIYNLVFLWKRNMEMCRRISAFLVFSPFRLEPRKNFLSSLGRWRKATCLNKSKRLTIWREMVGD